MNITWNAENYRKGFSFVPSYGEDVMQLLTVPQGSRVVDLGCGHARSRGVTCYRAPGTLVNQTHLIRIDSVFIIMRSEELISAYNRLHSQ